MQPKVIWCGYLSGGDLDMAKTKLLEGYLEYIRNSNDPNLKKCKEKYGQDFIFHSIEAWKNEMMPQDHNMIPSKELIQKCKTTKK